MDFNFDKIISDDFDWSIVDKAIHDEVVRLKERISHLETHIPQETSNILVSPDNEKDAKASAVGMAQSLDLDAAVRTVAKSGKTHGGGHNWNAEWGNFEISATFGAGTNSASIQLSAGYLGNEPTEVYIASDYGRYIEIFRYGPWVHRLLQHAGELRRAKEAQTKTNEANKAQQEAAKFQEVDF